MRNLTASSETFVKKQVFTLPVCELKQHFLYGNKLILALENAEYSRCNEGWVNKLGQETSGREADVFCYTIIASLFRRLCKSRGYHSFSA